MIQSAPDFSIARGRSLLVALSGGADSVALLHMLAEARVNLGLTLCAAHVDHSIRGDASRADAEFCRKCCAMLNVPFYMERIDVPRIAHETGEGLETAARRLRYEALRRIRIETGSDWIALAHHLDDQAETVLMHLLRGCGPDGIGGMDELSGDLYRPLLNVPKQTLEAYLTERSLSWRVDVTNLEPFTPRNRLRLHGMPVIEESYPAAATAIARYAESARVENRFMESLTAEVMAKHLESGAYGRRLLSPEQIDSAIRRRIFRHICGESLPHSKLLELDALCEQPRGRLEISGNLKAERTPTALYFLPKQPEIPAPALLPDEGCAMLGGIGMLRLCKSDAVPVRDNPFIQVLRRAALKGAVLRTRRDGDRFRPLNGGDRLLSDVLTDRKVDRPLRDTLPLVAAGNRVLWVAGVGIADEAKLLSPADDAVRLEWLPLQN